MRVRMEAPCAEVFDLTLPEGTEASADLVATLFEEESRLPKKLWDLVETVVDGETEYSVRLRLKGARLPAVRVHRVWFRNNEDVDEFSLTELVDPQPGDIVENLRGWGEEFDGVYAIERVTERSLAERIEEYNEMLEEDEEDDDSDERPPRCPPRYKPGELALSAFPEETQNTLPPWICASTLSANFQGMFRNAVPPFAPAHRVYVHTASIDHESVERVGGTVRCGFRAPRPDGFQRFVMSSDVESDLQDFVELLAALVKSPQPTAFIAMAPADPSRDDLYLNLSDPEIIRRGREFHIAGAMDVTLLDPGQIVADYVPRFSAWSLANLMLSGALPISDACETHTQSKPLDQ